MPDSKHETQHKRSFDSSPFPLVPFLKWAGGKRWLVREHLRLFPSSYERYIEPFLGGGSVFFALQPQRAMLSDLNPRLIETYQQVRDNPEYIEKILRQHDRLHNKNYYYEMRQKNYPRSPSLRAAQFIYLNRTCWNGLYRVNSIGKFNVPRGTKSRVLLNSDNFISISHALKRSTIVSQDFSKTLQKAGKGDFVYVDPPYTVKHKYNAFTKYNEKIFSWEDQIRLRNEIRSAIDRGAQIAISNADHQSIRYLYRDIGTMIDISRNSVIAANRSHRGRVDELLILSWK